MLLCFFLGIFNRNNAILSLDQQTIIGYIKNIKNYHIVKYVFVSKMMKILCFWSQPTILSVFYALKSKLVLDFNSRFSLGTNGTKSTVKLKYFRFMNKWFVSLVNLKIKQTMKEDNIMCGVQLGMIMKMNNQLYCSRKYNNDEVGGEIRYCPYKVKQLLVTKWKINLNHIMLFTWYWI